MHRTMKASLKAKLGSELGRRAADGAVRHASRSQRWCTRSSFVSQESFLATDGSGTTDPDFVVALRERMRQLRPVPPAWHGAESRRSFVHRKLATSTHVFVRVDAHKSSLQAPYQGPFKVIERHAKHFKLDLCNRVDDVSIDRLKTAFTDEPLQITPPVRAGAKTID